MTEDESTMKTPKTEFLSRLDDLQELIVRMKIQVECAELAARDSWEVNKEGVCYASLRRAEMLARKFSDTAISAQMEAISCTE